MQLPVYTNTPTPTASAASSTHCVPATLISSTRDTTAAVGVYRSVPVGTTPALWMTMVGGGRSWVKMDVRTVELVMSAWMLWIKGDEGVGWFGDEGARSRIVMRRVGKEVWRAWTMWWPRKPVPPVTMMWWLERSGSDCGLDMVVGDWRGRGKVRD